MKLPIPPRFSDPALEQHFLRIQQELEQASSRTWYLDRDVEHPHSLTVRGNLQLSDTTAVTEILDEDNFSSDSATALATQQSIKAYVDSASNLSLDELSDVTLSSLATGDLLRYNGSGWVNATLADAGISATGHTHVIADVTGLQTALDGKASSSHTHSLDDLSDVTITTVASGEFLKWNGSAWVNSTTPGAETVVGNLTTEAATYYPMVADGTSGNVSHYVNSTDLRWKNTATANQLLLANGTAATPILSFINDEDAGMYLPVSGRIGFATAGTLRATIGSGAFSFGADWTDNTSTAVDQFQIGNLSGNWGILGRVGSGNSFYITAADSNTTKLSRIALGAVGKLQDSSANTALDWSSTAVTVHKDVGIGTASPGAKLEVAGSGIFSSAGYLDLTVDQTDSGKISFGVTSATADSFINTIGNGAYAGLGEMKFLIEGSEKVRIDNSGNVGIGTASPGTVFHVQSGSANPARIITSSITNSSLLIGNTSTGSAVLTLDGANGDAAGADYFTIQQNNDLTANIYTQASAGVLTLGSKGTSNAITIDGANVGIGATSPGSLLHLSATAADAVLRLENSGTGNSSGIDFYRERLSGSGVVGGSVFLDSDTSTNYATLYIQAQSAGVQSGVTGALSAGNGARIKVGPAGIISFENGASESVRFDASGNVGIGTASPGSPLSIEDSTNQLADFYSTDTEAYIRIRDNSDSAYVSSDGGIGSFGGNVGSNANNINISLSSGNVGIGTTSPDEKLHVEGSVLIDAFNMGDEEGLFFREGFSSSNKYNLSILAKDHNGAFADGLSINGYDGISFCTGSNSRNEVMRIVGGSGSDVGNVGIGTTSPLDTLHVAGNTIVHTSDGPGIASYATFGRQHMHHVTAQNGWHSTATGSVTGLIRIRLPVAVKTQVANTMMSAWVDFFDYNGGNDGESWSMNLGGYASQSNPNKWYNCFASTLARRTDKSQYRVRFATDNTNGYFYVFIGETSSSWSYPQVQVRDVTGAYADANTTHWSGDWEITVGVGSLSGYTVRLDLYSETVASKLGAPSTGVVTCDTHFAVKENPTQIEDAATRTIDWSKGNQQVVDLDSTTTTTININDTTMVAGGSYIVLLQKNSGGAQTVNWTSSTPLLWVNGQTPVVGTATAGDITVVTFLYTKAATDKVVGAWYQAT